MAVDNAALDRLAAHLKASRIGSPRTDIIRVSSSGECSRKIGYKLLGFPGDLPTTNELVTFEIGHAYHHMLQKWLCEIGWTTPDLLEFPLADPTMRSRGSCDAVTVRLNAQGEPDRNGTRRLIEIKSITNVAQERYGKESHGAYTRLEKPRGYHLDQANVYASMWNRMVESGHYDNPLAMHEGRLVGELVIPNDYIARITMIYVGKDTSEMPIKIYTLAVSERKIERLKAKFTTIWSHVDKEELPPRDHNPFSGFPPCKFCPYLGLCLSEGVE